MLTRINTGFVLLFVGCLFLGLSHIPAVLVLGIAAMAALAMTELAEPLGLGKWIPATAGTALCLLAFRLDRLWMTVLLGALFFGYLVASLAMMAALPGKKSFHAWEKVLFPASVAMFFGAAYHLRQGENGLYALLLPVFLCAATDTFAYFIGRRFGKRPLAPLVSPKKTLEGAIGGTVLAVALTMILGLGLQYTGLLRVNLGLLALYALTVSIVGQFGDLCMSAVKRVADVKDFGDILPGHGGLLDRLDSCLLALPYTYLFIGCFGNMIH